MNPEQRLGREKREEPISQHEKAGDKGPVNDWFISVRLHWGYAAPQQRGATNGFTWTKCSEYL